MQYALVFVCFSFWKLVNLLLSTHQAFLWFNPPHLLLFLSYKHLFNESSHSDELCQKIVDLSVKTCHPYFFNQENINQLINPCQKRQKSFNPDLKEFPVILPNYIFCKKRAGPTLNLVAQTGQYEWMQIQYILYTGSDYATFSEWGGKCQQPCRKVH